MELASLIASARRWWQLFVAAVAVALLVALASTYVLPKRYQASTILTVGRFLENPNPSESDLVLAQQLGLAYAVMAQRGPVAEAVVTKLGLSQMPPFDVKLIPNTNLIEIKVEAATPREAQSVAAELARQLILKSPSGSSETEQQREVFVNKQLDDLQLSMAATQAEIDSLNKGMGQMTSARQIADTQTQLAALDSRLRSEQASFAALLSSTKRGAANTLSVLEPAALPSSPVGPSRLWVALGSILIGLTIAGVGVYIIETFGDRVKALRDVSQVVREHE